MKSARGKFKKASYAKIVTLAIMQKSRKDCAIPKLDVKRTEEYYRKSPKIEIVSIEVNMSAR